MACNSLSLLLLLALSAVLVNSLELEKIIGGNLVKSQSDHPYVVSIQNGTTHFCSGSLLDEKTILTASHCFLNPKHHSIKQYKVAAGQTNVKQAANTVGISHVYVHKKFNIRVVDENAYLDNDIAVIKLSSGFTLAEGSSINKIALPGPNDVFNGKKAVVAGYGDTVVMPNPNKGPDEYNYVSSDNSTLYSLEVTIVEDSDPGCFDRDMCYCVKTLKSNTGVCAGDSGDGLVVDKKIAGVLSSSDETCSDFVNPAHYTRVPKFLDWINKAVADMPTEEEHRVLRD